MAGLPETGPAAGKPGGRGSAPQAAAVGHRAPVCRRRGAAAPAAGPGTAGHYSGGTGADPAAVSQRGQQPDGGALAGRPAGDRPGVYPHPGLPLLRDRQGTHPGAVSARRAAHPAGPAHTGGMSDGDAPGAADPLPRQHEKALPADHSFPARAAPADSGLSEHAGHPPEKQQFFHPLFPYILCKSTILLATFWRLSVHPVEFVLSPAAASFFPRGVVYWERI